MSQRDQTNAFYRKQLPHWEVADGRYFVTLSLHDSVPSHAASEIREMSKRLQSLEGNEYINLQRRIFRNMENWLDKSEGACYLRNPDVAQMIMEAMYHREKSGIWAVFDYVIMPSHMHMFIQPLSQTLHDSMHLFKSWTGRQALALMGKKGMRFWHDDWFDHWSRSTIEDHRIQKYMRNNPEKAGLVGNYQEWPFASWADNARRLRD